MAPTATLLSHDEFTADATSFVSTSHTVHAGKPVFVAVESAEASPSTVPTLTGHSLTWTQVATVETDAGATRRRVTVFEGYPTADDTGTVTASFGAATQANCYITVVEWTGAHATDCTVQSRTAVGNAFGAQTLAFLASPVASSSVFAVVALNNNTGLTAGSSPAYTALADDVQASPVTSWLVEYVAQPDDPVDWTIDGASAVRYAVVIVEVKAASISASLGTAVDTQAAQVLGKAKARAVGMAAETDSALAISKGGITQPIAAALETDAAQALGRAKLRAIASATETDAAQVFGRAKLRILGIPLETDTAIGFGRVKTKALVVSTETDSALVITASMGVLVLGHAASSHRLASRAASSHSAVPFAGSEPGGSAQATSQHHPVPDGLSDVSGPSATSSTS